jgi:hydroxymethylglutaryl-CoA synthase
MAVEASLKALKMSGVNPKKIGAVFVGSESHPYAVKPTGTILGSFLGLKDYFCADLQFACKAGTAGIQIAAAMIEAGLINYGLVIASDKAQSRPGDALEYTAGAGAAAFVLGSKKDKFLAKVKSVYSVASDTPDFWRRPGCKYPEHTGRFTGEPSYFKHLTKSIKKILENNNLKIKDINKLVLHMPNAKFPLKLAKRLGVSKNQLKDSFLVPSMGNPYTASSFLGLAASLSQAKKNEKILMASYGSGAGSDGILLEAKTNKKAKTVNLKSQLKQGIYLNYADYLKHTNYLKI